MEDIFPIEFYKLLKYLKAMLNNSTLKHMNNEQLGLGSFAYHDEAMCSVRRTEKKEVYK